jgi:thioredoxin reductase (NADPH)
MARCLRERIADSGIEVLFGHEVRELAGDRHLERVTVENVGSGGRCTIDAGVLMVLIGAAPSTEWLAGAVALDEDGFVLTVPALEPDPGEGDTCGLV